LSHFGICFISVHFIDIYVDFAWREKSDTRDSVLSPGGGLRRGAERKFEICEKAMFVIC
jgi:hypothetical protein